MTDQGLGNDHSLNAAMTKTSDTMKSIHDEFARVSVIAGSDLRKRKIKEMKNDGPKKEPYATDEEVARARVLCAQLRAASHSFVEAYHELAGLRDTWGLRQAKRSAAKVVRDLEVATNSLFTTHTVCSVRSATAATAPGGAPCADASTSAVARTAACSAFCIAVIA